MVVVLDDNVAFLGFDALDVLLGDKRAAAGNAHDGREMLMLRVWSCFKGFRNQVAVSLAVFGFRIRFYELLDGGCLWNCKSFGFQFGPSPRFFCQSSH